MPKYIIERTIPEAGKLSPNDLRAIATKSNSVLSDMGTDIQWLFSYVTDHQIICTYIAPNEDMLREHARRGGFPADVVSVIHTLIDPTTAEA